MKRYILFLLLLIPLSAWAGSGVFVPPQQFVDRVQFAGVTSSSYDGDDATDYDGANTICDGEFTDSHVCHNDEMMRLIDQGDDFGSSTADVWVNAGAPGDQANSNDCYAWSQTGITYFGRYWKLSTLRAHLSGCAFSQPYACCR